MRHRRQVDLRSRLLAAGRPAAALLAVTALAATLLASAGGAKSDPAADVVQIARQQLGDAYVWGGNGPDEWDCSGLTSRLWREVGGVDDIPRVSRDQQAWAVPIPREQLRLGDLVFYGAPVTHVGLYSGDGRMIDASSARKGVIERPIWSSGVLRFGRVPRPGMPAVRPWAGSEARAEPRASRSIRPAARPTLRTQTAPAVPRPVAFPGRPTPVRQALVPLRGLPAPNLAAAHRVAAAAARNAKSVHHSRAYDDLSLVRVAWHHSGGGILPPSRAAIEAASRPVPLRQVRIGDLVVYGRTADHLGVYLGHGYMVDASPSLKRVLVRRVFSSPTVRFVRPPVVRR